MTESFNREFVDQCGFVHQIDEVPQRIVSVVPSLTEFLFDLQLNDSIVGLTKFCIHPKSLAKKKVKIGGTKALDIAKIKELKPDIIIANKEENTKKDIEELKKYCPVFLTNIKDQDSAIEGLLSIGSLLDKEEKASEIVSIIENQKKQYEIKDEKIDVCYLIWKDPYMTIGQDTFIHSMLESAGFNNVFGDRQRYPKLSLNQIKSQNPELILLSSEPFPFKDKHAKIIREVIDCDIIQVNGELFSWYGSRMIFAYKYFNDLYKEINLTDERSE